MKVAIVSTHPIQYHTPWFRELARRNIDLTVYYALLPDQQQQAVGFGEPFAWDIPLLEGYQWALLPNSRKEPRLSGFFHSSTPAIHSRLSGTMPDAVILTGWQSLPLIQALWAAVRLRIPCILRGESNGLRSRPLWVRGLHKQLFSFIDAFLCIGKLNREFYLGYGIPEQRIFSAPYFVDNQRFADQFCQARRERDALRIRWKIDDPSAKHQERRICFLFAGKLEPKKRPLDLLRAFEAASRANSDIHLLVVGTGELMDEARKFAESRSLPVTFAGFLNQTEITQAYAAADCLVLPSDYGETWGLVVNEAMSCGLPALVSDRVGCGPDLVEERVTGGVFPCGDVETLAGKLREFANSAELAQMGEQAKLRISDYSVENAVEGTLAAIEFVKSRQVSKAAGRRTIKDVGQRHGPLDEQTLAERLRSGVYDESSSSSVSNSSINRAIVYTNENQ